MTIEEKYLELRKKAVNPKIIDTCSPTCTLKTDQNLAYIVLFKRRTKTPSVLIFHDTLPIWLSIRCPLKKIVFAS